MYVSVVYRSSPSWIPVSESVTVDSVIDKTMPSGVNIK